MQTEHVGDLHCCLNTLALPRPFTLLNTLPQGVLQIKAGKSPLWAPDKPPIPPTHLLTLSQHSLGLAMRHGSTDDRLMRRKYFYRIAFRRSPENQWQHFYGHQLADWALLSLYLLWVLRAGEAVTPVRHRPQLTDSQSELQTLI